MADFPKKQQQCLIPKYLLDYTTELNKNHPDPSDPWGGGGGGSPIEAGEGIEITGTDTKTISIDNTVVATKDELFSGDYNDLTNKPTIPEGVTILTISTSVKFTPTQIANFIAKPGNYLFKEADRFNGDDYFRIDTIMSGSIRLTKTFVASSTTLYSELFYINRSTGAVTKTNYTINVPEPVYGTNDGTNWTSLTIDNETYGLASGGSTYTAGNGIDITNDEISVDNTVAMKTDLPDAVIGQHDSYNWTILTIGADTYSIPQIPDGNVVLVNQQDNDYIQKINDNWPNVLFRCSNFPDPEYTFLPAYEINDTYIFKTIKAETNGNEITHKVVTLEFDKSMGVTITTEESISNDYNDLINTPTIPDTSNMVTTDTQQNITASKTFGNYNNNITLDTTNNNIKVVNSSSRSTLNAGQLENVYVDVSPNGHEYDIKVNTNGIKYQLDNDYFKYTGIGFETPTNHNDLVFPDKSGTLAVTSDIITSYNDLTDKPSIPTKTSDLTNDSGYITGITSSDVTTALGYTPGTSNFSGSYTDLTDKPTIPTATSQLTNDSGYITSADLPTDVAKVISIDTGDTFTQDQVAQLIGNDTILYVDGECYIKNFYNTSPFYLFYSKVNASTGTNNVITRDEISINQNGTWAKLNDTITLSDVATSGSYNDLTNKPSIPTVNDNTITITQGGVTKGSFTLNQNTNQTIDVDDVPGMIGEVIYDNKEQNVASITLSNNIDDYSFIDVQYTCSDYINHATDKMLNTIRIYKSGNSFVNTIFQTPSMGYAQQNSWYSKNGEYRIASTTSISVNSQQWQISYLPNNNPKVLPEWRSTSEQAWIIITKVIGYKANSSPLTSETWTFTLQDDTTVTKNIVVF